MKSLRHSSLVLLSFLLLGWMQFSALKLSAVAVTTPEISCLEVLPDGSVIISWMIIDNTLLHQNIYYSENPPGPTVTFSLIGQPGFSLGMNSFHHITANANVKNLYYYVEIEYPTDTVQSVPSHTMRLSATEVFTNPGIIQLEWNEMHSNDLPYQIWQEFPIGDWHMIGDNIERLLFNDTLQNNICNDTVSYRIEVENPSGCKSVSSTAGGWFSETRQPLPSLFDSISVNAAGEVVLSWSLSDDILDTRGTIIYLNDNPIATIPITDPNQTYTDASDNPCTNPNLVYAIAAEDNCGNKSEKKDDQKLSPLFLHQPIGDVCQENVTLQWNPYINANPPLDGYQILYSLNGDPFVPAGEVDPTTTTFTHELVIPGEDYTYAVRAKFGGFTSTSCQKLIITGGYKKPTFVYLANASVLPDGQVEMTLDLDLYPTDCQWKVWRSEVAGIPELEYTFDRSDISVNPFVFTDSTADGNLSHYDYQLEVIDSCQKSTFFSNTMTTMHLTGTAISNEINQLNWTPFSGFDAGIKQYHIFRMADGIAPSQPIASVLPGEELAYTDDLNGVTSASGVFTYWVEAEENQGNTYGYAEKSLSNQVTFAQRTDLYMPNAFRPGGVTPTFKPVFLFFNGPSYLFQVYDRWGQLIFETHESSEGWEGDVQGKSAATGTYLYRLVYQDFDGKSFEQRGAFTLVR